MSLNLLLIIVIPTYSVVAINYDRNSTIEFFFYRFIFVMEKVGKIGNFCWLNSLLNRVPTFQPYVWLLLINRYNNRQLLSRLSIFIREDEKRESRDKCYPRTLTISEKFQAHCQLLQFLFFNKQDSYDTVTHTTFVTLKCPWLLSGIFDNRSWIFSPNECNGNHLVPNRGSIWYEMITFTFIDDQKPMWSNFPYYDLAYV